MRRTLGAAALATLLVVIGVCTTTPARASEVSFAFHYSNLSPHGDWLVSAQYGRVWQPAVYSPGWNPYYDGHWVYSDVGWIWVSDYPWGATCYHYGTWTLDPVFGWVWVPGYVWAPAWVVFRTGPDYIGWAPVAPGYSVRGWFSFGEPATGPFVFVSSHHFLAPRIRGYALPASQKTVFVKNTKIINNLVVENNVIVNRGPDLKFVERSTGRRIRQIPVERVARAAPGPRVTRVQLGFDGKGPRGLKAAQPVSPAGRAQRVEPQPQKPAMSPQAKKPPRGKQKQRPPVASKPDRTQRSG